MQPGRNREGMAYSCDRIRACAGCVAWAPPGRAGGFADLKGRAATGKATSRLRNYHYRVFAKRSGSVRLIESPKSRLKELQRQILALLLDAIPVHPAVHGFCKGRSIRTFAVPHVGQRESCEWICETSFLSISRARVRPYFVRPATLSRWPTCLVESVQTPLHETCGTASVFTSILFNFVRFALCMASPHLPQGAPIRLPSQTSAATGYCRLAGLADLSGRHTRDTQTISHFRAMRNLNGASTGSHACCRDFA